MFVIGSSEGKEGVIAEECEVVKKNGEVTRKNGRENHLLASLMMKTCGVYTLLAGAQAAIQRLQVYGAQQASKMSFNRFSALSDDKQRLYVPIVSGKVLRISADKIEKENGQ